MIILWILLAVIVVLVLWAVGLYNSLVGLKNRVAEAWSGIDVQLKRRSDLIPNLVETVKGYAAHERETLDAVISARNNLTAAKGPQETAAADNALSGAMKSLFAVAEAYPDLKANQNFLQLQQQLSQVEDEIAFSRRYYNGTVEGYNTKQQTFPAVFIARAFGHQPAEYFEAEPGSKEAPKVDFS